MKGRQFDQDSQFFLLFPFAFFFLSFFVFVCLLGQIPYLQGTTEVTCMEYIEISCTFMEAKTVDSRIATLCMQISYASE